MTPIQIMALIVAIISAIKIVLLLIKPRAWGGIVKAIYAKPTLTILISMILVAGSLYYLLDAGMMIVEIFAVMFLFMFLMLMGIAAYSKDMVALSNKLLKNRKILKKAWIALVVWIFLIVWVLYTIFI